MDKIKLAISSRTVWTIVALFIVGGVNGVHDVIPTSIVPFVDGALALLAVYFRVNPRV